ncbi:hypothetical protein CCR75_004284 [Bremia lactucae]|uniref:Uncharacterized protein n=1 Tax=Bremia lactucae TaxID=4779 RepID=A0A976II29_BRELC|nr:hypothetical protein CCR75_004284 [Bremia lactucae]
MCGGSSSIRFVVLSIFATFDLFKGFSHLLLHADCREFFSFVKNDTVYTPTRVLQGATDSPILFQNQMQEEFRDMLLTNGNQRDPQRVSALFSLPLPALAADLQKLSYAANWLRESIINFAQHAAPMQPKLEAGFDGHSRKQRYAEGLKLTLTPEEQQQSSTFLNSAENSVKLLFSSNMATVWMTTDANDRGWSLIVSQVNELGDLKSLTSQKHELLLCKGSSTILVNCRERGISCHRGGKRVSILFCDHANLIQIFCPHTGIRKHARGKLQSWALILFDYRYEILHVRGCDDIWADLVSRWLPLSKMR